MATQKRKIPVVFDKLVEVGVYEERHRPEHQEQVGQGYPLNPMLRDNFFNTPNDHREALEVADWWDLPFIESTTWQDTESDLRRAQQARGGDLSTAEAEAEIEAHKTAFHSFNPGVTKYMVRSLDGGSWDRPSMWGTFTLLKDAIECCEKGPAWRRARAPQS